MNPIKTFLVVLLYMLCCTVARAQGKHEYATIVCRPYDKVIQVTIEGQGFTEKKIPKEKAEGHADSTAGLEEVRKMEDQGWELVNMTSSVLGQTTVFVFLLRRAIGDR